MTRVAILLYLSLVIAGFGWKGVKSFSLGAPSAACDNLSPNPTQHGAPPQTSAVPYSIDLSSLNDPTSGQPAYSPGQTYTRKYVKFYEFTSGILFSVRCIPVSLNINLV